MAELVRWLFANSVDSRPKSNWSAEKPAQARNAYFIVDLIKCGLNAIEGMLHRPFKEYSVFVTPAFSLKSSEGCRGQQHPAEYIGIPPGQFFLHFECTAVRSKGDVGHQGK